MALYCSNLTIGSVDNCSISSSDPTTGLSISVLVNLDLIKLLIIGEKEKLQNNPYVSHRLVWFLTNCKMAHNCPTRSSTEACVIHRLGTCPFGYCSPSLVTRLGMECYKATTNVKSGSRSNANSGNK
ncbi:hypothetical protein EPI10_005556 [Gossypium australe]|uniref:Uncharacterized protein n=1 Tax=Gossypium australe TaxID=47621 RepID=A0A5B6WQ42_9ROSI|nr:hypothetical protein EPI10_005556 [Gossypium australe]